MRLPTLVCSLLALAACGKSEPPAPSPSPSPSTSTTPDAAPPTTPEPPPEPHLADVRQLTFGGENAEAYWSFAGDELILQARVGAAECDRIYRMPLTGAGADGKGLVPVSSGLGATTCSYFMPGDERVVYASTHLGGDACPPKPDMSQGYVWALYDSYDVFSAKKDGSDVVRLTDTPGYDAEATVCGDGSIVFTSVRDGDIDLYRMKADGSDVVRLTDTPGYDGGAFFNRDCTRLVWRASRPREGKELDEFKALLGKGLVRPSKLELWVGNADGSEATQITYLGAASFAPFWHPNETRVLFSSNAFDPKGRDFDILAIDLDGTDLERITTTPGFDGFPMFAPDGKTLAFASNRATAPGQRDTNVFLARWVDAPVVPLAETAADRIAADVAWLADPARDGRGVGTPGLEAAGAWLEARMQALGLAPDGDAGGFRQAFPVTTAITAGAGTALTLDGAAVAADQWVPLGFSPASADAAGDLALAGWGIVAPELGHDDFAGLDVKGKIVVVRRFVPDETWATEAKRRHGDIRQKAWHARQRGAVGLVVVDDPVPPEPSTADWKAPDEVKLPPLQPEGHGDAGIPVAVVARAVGAPIVKRLSKGEGVRATLATRLEAVTTPAFNVVGRIAAAPADGRTLPGVVVVGAHYDHLGHGGKTSLAPGKDEPHLGADDNASGTAALLEIARALKARAGELRRDVVLVGFSGEEAGVLGSSHFTRMRMPKPEAGQAPAVVAMLNMDMVGRLRGNRLQVLGTDTAEGWDALLQPACDAARVVCAAAGDGGLGPSDQMPFYLAGAPVLHFFTGTHLDYHKPSDVAARVNAGGAAQVAAIVGDVALALAGRAPLTYKPDARGPAPRGDVRSFNASLGTIPDYAGPGPGKSGMLLAGVRPGGAADKAGLRRGDVLVRVGASAINSIEDLMFVLNAARPGETTTAVVVRDGVEVAVEVTFQESTRPR